MKYPGDKEAINHTFYTETVSWRCRAKAQTTHQQQPAIQHPPRQGTQNPIFVTLAEFHEISAHDKGLQ